MRTSRQNHTKQLNFCLESTHLTRKHSNLLIALNGDNQGRIDHITKCKPFREFQKPLIGFTPESFPHLHEDKFRLTYVSSEVTVKFIILWICDRSSQQ